MSLEEIKAAIARLTPDELSELAAYIAGRLSHAAEATTMDEDRFWEIIDLLDWEREGDDDAVMAPAVAALGRFSTEDIHRFHDLLHEKLYALDGRRFAEHLGSNRYPPKKGRHFSVDSFLYARCCVVANGRDFFLEVLADPAKMPKEYTFESLLYLPQLAWKMKTGRDDYDYSPETWCETFSNPEGWPGIVTIKERILKSL